MMDSRCRPRAVDVASRSGAARGWDQVRIRCVSPMMAFIGVRIVAHVGQELALGTRLASASSLACSRAALHCCRAMLAEGDQPGGRVVDQHGSTPSSRPGTARRRACSGWSRTAGAPLAPFCSQPAEGLGAGDLGSMSHTCRLSSSSPKVAKRRGQLPVGMDRAAGLEVDPADAMPTLSIANWVSCNSAMVRRRSVVWAWTRCSSSAFSRRNSSRPASTPTDRCRCPQHRPGRRCPHARTGEVERRAPAALSHDVASASARWRQNTRPMRSMM